MIKTDIILPLGYNTDSVKEALMLKLPLEKNEIKNFTIVKRSLDASDKTRIHYKATVAVSLSAEREKGLLKMKKKVAEYEIPHLTLQKSRLTSRPIVVGAGPAGLFAALALAEAGARPIVIERGLPVERRSERVRLFSTLGVLDTECNIQYGEGGAGTYSDGKLKVGALDAYKYKILTEFISAGAEEEILYTVGAHLGTDRLSDIVKNIRGKIISLGADFIFSAKLTEIITKVGKIAGCKVEIEGKTEFLEAENIIVAAGHSARDTFEALLSAGARLTPRPFGVGVRIEHPREYINELVYGKENAKLLESASYHLVTHLKNGRSVYSFCMCPGGTVVPAASEAGGIVTNGMSEHKRDAENSNAALLVSLTPDDFPSDSPLAGLDLQRQIERCAYTATGSYRAPSESLSELISGKKSALSEVSPSYPLGTEHVLTREYLPSFVTDSLAGGVADFDAWLPGYALGSAAITGPETRSTSPVRVERDGKTLEAVGIEGLYPIGEGAGYSGGIISSARDGLLAAEALLKK